jgi:hypothetical protein
MKSNLRSPVNLKLLIFSKRSECTSSSNFSYVGSGVGWVDLVLRVDLERLLDAEAICGVRLDDLDVLG